MSILEERANEIGEKLIKCVIRTSFSGILCFKYSLYD